MSMSLQELRDIAGVGFSEAVIVTQEEHGQLVKTMIEEPKGDRVAIFESTGGKRRRASLRIVRTEHDDGQMLTLEEPGEPYIRVYRDHTQYHRMAVIMHRWGRESEQVQRMRVLIDDNEVANLPVLEGRQVNGLIESCLPGWKILTPYWAIPGDIRDVANGPCNRVSVEVSARYCEDDRSTPRFIP